MKKKKITQKVFLGLLISIFLVTNITVTNNAYIQSESKYNLTTIEDLIPQPEIIITDDEGFGPSGYNFPGDGSAGNPYRIEGYNITSGGPHGILIDASGGGSAFNVSFIIKNCWITAIEVCIKIVDAYPSLVTIDNCTCVNTVAGDGIGIHLVRCDGAIVTNCKCNFNFHTGIRLDTTAGALLENNICYSNKDEGIYLDNASDNGIFKGNTCKLNGNGFYNEISHNNNFLLNTIANNSLEGIMIVNSHVAVIEYNVLKTNGLSGVYAGIYYTGSDNGQVVYNDIEGSTGYGVKVDVNSDNLIVHHNNFLQNNVGGTSQGEEDFITGHINATWYDTVKQEGNYWSDYTGPGVYDIDGTVNNFDPYPLNSVIIIPEISFILWGLAILYLISLGAIFLKRRR